MEITFEEFRAACKHNEGFEDIECNTICVLLTPELKKQGSHHYTGTEILCNRENCPFTKAEAVQRTYLMEYLCYNCGFRFSRRVPRGAIAKGLAGECPRCGIKDYDSAWGVHAPTCFMDE